jgi:hypothetical protein
MSATAYQGVAYATSDLEVETDQEEEVYRLQFGS